MYSSRDDAPGLDPFSGVVVVQGLGTDLLLSKFHSKELFEMTNSLWFRDTQPAAEMEGIMNLLKYLLVFFNFVIFVSIILPFLVFILIKLYPCVNRWSG